MSARAGLLWLGLFAAGPLEAADGDTGLVLRRAYLTLNADFSDRFYGRARLEINQAGDFVNDDFDTGLKDLYLGGRFGQHRLVAGLTSTPTFDLVENGIRYYWNELLFCSNVEAEVNEGEVRVVRVAVGPGGRQGAA